jgi:uncharacterized protein (TIGR03083 family)
MTSDQGRLMGYVETWRSAADDLVTLLRSLDDEDWARPTDLAGWDVKGVAAHVAHLESDLCGVKQKRVEVPELEHLTAPNSIYTEMGLIAREDLSGAQITDEIEHAVAVRYEQLQTDPPTDGKAAPPRTPGRIDWNWETMLGNRLVDVWMHEQDIRRAVDRPGGMNTAAAQHTVQIFARSFGYTVGKRVAPPAGTTVVLDVAGVSPVHLAVEVNERGRAVPVTAIVEQPTVHLGMDTETFVILSGGRRAVSAVPVTVIGDRDLGGKVLAALAVTP